MNSYRIYLRKGNCVIVSDEGTNDPDREDEPDYIAKLIGKVKL